MSSGDQLIGKGKSLINPNDEVLNDGIAASLGGNATESECRSTIHGTVPDLMVVGSNTVYGTGVTDPLPLAEGTVAGGDIQSQSVDQDMDSPSPLQNDLIDFSFLGSFGHSKGTDENSETTVAGSVSDQVDGLGTTASSFHTDTPDFSFPGSVGHNLGLDGVSDSTIPTGFSDQLCGFDSTGSRFQTDSMDLSFPGSLDGHNFGADETMDCTLSGSFSDLLGMEVDTMDLEFPGSSDGHTSDRPHPTRNFTTPQGSLDNLFSGSAASNFMTDTVRDHSQLGCLSSFEVGGTSTMNEYRDTGQLHTSDMSLAVRNFMTPDGSLTDVLSGSAPVLVAGTNVGSIVNPLGNYGVQNLNENSGTFVNEGVVSNPFATHFHSVKGNLNQQSAQPAEGVLHSVGSMGHIFSGSTLTSVGGANAGVNPQGSALPGMNEGSNSQPFAVFHQNVEGSLNQPSSHLAAGGLCPLPVPVADASAPVAHPQTNTANASTVTQAGPPETGFSIQPRLWRYSELCPWCERLLTSSPNSVTPPHYPPVVVHLSCGHNYHEECYFGATANGLLPAPACLHCMEGVIQD